MCNVFIMIGTISVLGYQQSHRITYTATHLLNHTQINKDTLKNISKILGENLENDDIRRMIQLADDNFDGNVNFEDFVNILSEKYTVEHYEFFNPNKKVKKSLRLSRRKNKK